MNKFCLFVCILITINLNAGVYGPKNSRNNPIPSGESKDINSQKTKKYKADDLKIGYGQPNWQAIGAYIMDNASDKIKNSSDLTKTKYLVSHTTKIIDLLGYKPSNSRSHRLDRPVSGLKCSDISNIIYDSIKGGTKEGIKLQKLNYLYTMAMMIQVIKKYHLN